MAGKEISTIRLSKRRDEMYTWSFVEYFIHLFSIRVSDHVWSERVYPITSRIPCLSVYWTVIYVCLTGHSSVIRTCVICGKASCRALRLDGGCAYFRLAMSSSIVVGILQAIFVNLPGV